MPIINENLYLERMATTMTREEKLFFLDQIDIEDYDIIIDFGGADGALIKAIQKYRKENSTQFKNGLYHHIDYIIVDNYFVDDNSKAEYLFPDQNRDKTFIKNSLEEIEKQSLKDYKVLFILSSVLHELNSNIDFMNLYDFCKNYVNTIVARDMCFSSNRTMFNEKEYNLILSLLDKEPKFKEVLQLTRGNPWLVSLYEYFLKYEFEYNWENEIKEFYLHNNIKFFEKMVSEIFDLIYEKNYILPYRKQRVKEDFNFEMTLPTHRQIILERNLDNIKKED